MVRTLAFDGILSQYLQSQCLEGVTLEGVEGTRRAWCFLLYAYLHIMGLAYLMHTGLFDYCGIRPTRRCSYNSHTNCRGFGTSDASYRASNLCRFCRVVLIVIGCSIIHSGHIPPNCLFFLSFCLSHSL